MFCQDLQPMTGQNGYKSWQNIRDCHHQITERYVLDNGNDDYVKFECPVLHGSNKDSCVSYQR
jgi:hypothetical protein